MSYGLLLSFRQEQEAKKVLVNYALSKMIREGMRMLMFGRRLRC